MRLVIQRVNQASVKVNAEIVGQTSKGLMVLVGFHQADSNVDLNYVASKLIEMRIFSNAKGRFDLSVKEINGAVLLVPQFTLFADTRKGRRPDFFSAMNPKDAQVKFQLFVDAVKATGLEQVQTGIFGANMQVNLENDGPVTIIFDSENTF